MTGCTVAVSMLIGNRRNAERMSEIKLHEGISESIEDICYGCPNIIVMIYNQPGIDLIKVHL